MVTPAGAPRTLKMRRMPLHLRYARYVRYAGTLKMRRQPLHLRYARYVRYATYLEDEKTRIF